MENITFSTPLKFFLLLLLFTIPLLQPIHCDESLIEEICKNTPFYDLCVASLQSDSQSLNSDVQGLSCIMAKDLLTNASELLNYIQVLIKGTADDLQLEKALANCAESYIPEVKYNLPQAIDAVNQGHYSFAGYVISDAGKQADSCEKGFKGSDTSPLTDRNKIFRNLCDVAAAMLKMMVRQHH
ncbi:hypothetical protein ACFE04_004994 [Oxalis oulophora]